MIIVAAAAIWLVLSTGVAAVAARGNPALALRWKPDSTAAAARLAAAKLARKPSAADRAEAGRLARSVLARDPTNVTAVRVLAILASTDSDPRRSTRLLNYSRKLSSRDLVTRLWLIEEAVGRNDIPDALLNYDIALRTSGSEALLMPVLIAATAQEPIARALSARLLTAPPWREYFLDRLVDEGPSPDMLALIAEALRRGGRPLSKEQAAHLIERLAREGAFAAAYRVYAGTTAGRGAPADIGLRDGGFAGLAGQSDYPPFDWALSTDAGRSSWVATTDARPNDPALFFEAELGRGGAVASQLLLLRPGRYRIGAVAGLIGAEPLSRPMLTIDCPGTAGARLLALDFPAAGAKGARFTGNFSVPAGCAAQTFAVTLRGNYRRADAPGWVDDIAIRRTAP